MPDKKNTTEAVTEERNDPSVARTMENIRELTEKNLAISEEILEKTKHINRFVTLSQIMGVIKLLLIVVPIILGVLYLPSLLKGITPIFGQVLDVYKELLGVKQGSDDVLNGLDPNKIDMNKIDPDIIKKYMK
ncbi:hypothetical protein A2303_03600 [Candidatus Falkowbacteria bacterium RIFOXYB2_FULL_47_14]|uniref:Uncharacterized protein n=1 Tax=Candidatus Falkowbacteria bacterium RIFOXYA2_FULL_47_19 TaxID=1797994 RepID=A0A1F5SI68_9BACT|nr:MAG: hypothetical protein A2227_03145 [Candidatus Falkowbacteria bacterium RIFOXYA2_FULL_47_19]OGF36692.1 MAG: hypothetical protein A2468_02620 [Candidatus Falkowbacteria bacterium RIFOXYC2_FULL_46_15]OGF42484.1 MAG: hypothetical protein A2303_03600 [Candidatus Falkowbacteria bacterium RIFOXYB2_FULL_47_14]